ncbi:MAG: GntR family transcriptional regulator [Oscillospiraceae bacterium]|nr:GntR family transcriptional regulator [Oscillospiraceae bacterium]
MEENTSKSENLRERAYNTIKEMILTGKLAPGEMVNEKMLMEALGIGRTPVREAIGVLTFEKITSIVPRKGTYVSRITLEDIDNLYQVRDCFEPFIVEIATPKISKDILIWFKENFEAEASKSPEGMASVDGQFHRYIASATNNPYIVQMFEPIHFQNERLRHMSTRFLGTMEDVLSGHLVIIERMLTRDAQGAAHAMREHLAFSRKVSMSLDLGDIKLF